mgnify:CR=1 FL=1
MAVEFHDFTVKVQGAISDEINAKLEEVAGEVESAAKRNQEQYNKTGNTEGGWQHHVDDATHTATIGNSLENAIWEEFGTGEHALKGNGRKGGWFYEDDEGKGHFTHGKKPRRHFWKAYTSMKNKIINYLQNSLKGL